MLCITKKTGERAVSTRQPPLLDFQNEIIEMYVVHEDVEEGVERKRGERFNQMDF